MNTQKIRLRFAPAPTGLMHLGNIRTALMNFLFARQKDGTFVLRIEDTDQERNYDPEALKIVDDLTWLGLSYDEGPQKGGPYAPYFQSQRTQLYQDKLQELVARNLVYRCFCSTEELERKRQRQIAAKQPPRYDRTCLKLTHAESESRAQMNEPFVWRLKIDTTQKVTVHDLARGSITYAFEHFSDFPVTRADGSFTFLFANAVDDIDMNITHIIRGEDHLTNTGAQAALYMAFNAPLPTFWHLPIIANAEGKKLSKRDFGFSFNDLREAGFLPEALANYLAIIGGGTFDHEIMSINELISAMDFEHIHSTGFVRYDLEKLRWVNQQWIARLDIQDVINRCMPYLMREFPQADKLPAAELEKLISRVKTDVVLLADVNNAVRFYFAAPQICLDDLAPYQHARTIISLLQELCQSSTVETLAAQLKQRATAEGASVKEIFLVTRYVLMGSFHGPSVHDLIELLGIPAVHKRIHTAATLYT